MKKLIFTLLFCIIAICGFAEITAFRGKVKDGYNFWLYQPQTTKADSVVKPVIIFLHGNSLCGTDLNRVRRYGCIDAVEKGLKIDALIIAPQNPGGAWKPKKIKNILEWVQGSYKTDSSRVYVVGMSLGGYGTMDFAGTYPKDVAAAVALCGGSTLSNYEGLSQVPLWVMHGTADRAVSIKESQKVVNALRAKRDTSLVIFDKMEGLGHSALARVFYMPQLYDWLFSHNKVDSTMVNADTEINSASLKGAYKNINKSGVKPKIIDERASATVALSKSGSASGDAVKSGTTGKVHMVKKGDTLGAIAIKYGTTVSKLCKSNNITAKSILRLGQRIKV